MWKSLPNVLNLKETKVNAEDSKVQMEAKFAGPQLLLEAELVETKHVEMLQIP